MFLPTRELAAQVHEHARLHVQAAGFPCVLCVGGVAERAQLDAFAHPHPRRRPRVVVGTPGRIKDFRDRGVFSTDRVVFQVLDEADRLLDGGFERDVEEVAVPPGGACATVCLSATMPPKLERFLRRRLPPDHAHVVIGGPMGGNVGGSVEHVTCACRPEETVAAVMDAVDAYAARRGGGEEVAEDAENAENNGEKETRDPENEDEKKPLPGSSGRAIVFAETKVAAERLSAQLAVAYEVRRPRRFVSRPGKTKVDERTFVVSTETCEPRNKRLQFCETFEGRREESSKTPRRRVFDVHAAPRAWTFVPSRPRFRVNGFTSYLHSLSVRGDYKPSTRGT